MSNLNERLSFYVLKDLVQNQHTLLSALRAFRSHVDLMPTNLTADQLDALISEMEATDERMLDDISSRRERNDFT